MSEIYDEDIEEDVNSSSVKEDSNVYNEDFQSSSSSNNDKKKKVNNPAEPQRDFQKDKKSKSSHSLKSSNRDDLNEYDQDFDEDEDISKPKKEEKKLEVQLKPSQAQISQQKQKENQANQSKGNFGDSINESEDGNNTLKSSINEDQLRKQQLSFIGNLNQFLVSQNNAAQDQGQPKKLEQSIDQNNKRDAQKKPPIPQKQRYIKDYIEEKPKKKDDIESVPNDEEIEDIIRKNQYDFLQMIKEKSSRNPSPMRPTDDFKDQNELEDTNQYYEEEEENLDVIYETDREDSQAGRMSQNESYDEHYHSQSYGSSVYQHLSAKDIQDDNQYYEDTQLAQKSQLKTKKNTQKEYERIIQEKQMELRQLQEVQKQREQLNINIDVEDEEMLQIAKKAKQKEKEIQVIKIMQERMRYGCRKCAEAHTQKDREAYREENEHLRKVINEQETQIKLLKVQLRKSSDRALDNSFSSVGSTSTSVIRKIEQLENDKEKLKQENTALRNRMKDVKNSSSSQLNRQQKLNIEIQKALGSDIRKLQEKENKKPVDENLEKQFRVQTERVAELRLDLEKMIKKYEDQKQKIKAKDEQIITLKQKVQGRNFQKYVDKINELQATVDNFEDDKEAIRDQMQLDKQLQVLFPKQMVLICNFFNICIAVEEVKRGRYQRMANLVFNQAQPIFSYLKKIYHRIKDTIKFKISKKPADHPDQKEIIRATIKAWNESPDIVARQMKSQQKELKELRIRFIEMDNELETLRTQNDQLQKDVEILRSRNSVIETRLSIDKNKLVNNVILQLKFHNIEDEEEDYLLELKKLINIIKEGPPLLISQAERDAFKKEKELEAEKERKKREREERKKEMALKKQQRLQEKREKEEKEKEEQLLQQKQKGVRPSSALRSSQNQLPLQNKETRPGSALNSIQKGSTLSKTTLKSNQVTPKQTEDKGNKQEKSQTDLLSKSQENKNFRVSNLTNKLRQSLNSTKTNNNNNTNS